MGITVTIAGNVVNIRNNSLVINDALAQRSTCNFVVLDPAGTTRIVDYSAVSVVDSVLGTLFAGFVFDAHEKNLFPNPNNDIPVVCMDNQYLVDKHFFGVKSNGNIDKEKINQYAGNIATQLLHDYLAQEGITANYAFDMDTTQADFAAGTLSGVTATNSIDDGDLELTLAGSTVTKTETSTADFNSNLSLVGLDTTGDQLQLASHSALQFTAQCGNNFGNAYAYQNIWKGSYVIQTGDFLSYYVWVNSGSPNIKCGIDIIFSDGTNIRDTSVGPGGGLGVGLPDQYGLGCHPNTDLSNFANDQWYLRHIGVGYAGITGKTAVQVNISFEGDTGGQYTAYVYDVILFATNGTTHRVDFYYGAGPHASIVQPNANSKISANGYSKVVLTPIIAYEQSGTRIANTTSVAGAGIYRSSLLSWTEMLAANTAIAVSTSVDGGATFQGAANFAQLAGLLPGVALSGHVAQTQQALNITGKDPTVTPVLNDITWSVFPSYAATKSDTATTYTSQADWTGAISSSTNIATQTNGDVTPIMNVENWDDASLANQTLFGAGSPVNRIFKGVSHGGLNLECTGTFDVRERLDSAGNWNTDFTMSVDVQVLASNQEAGLEYLTTSWANPNNEFAYCAMLNTTYLKLYRGPDGGAPSVTTLGTFNFPGSGLTVGDWHTLTVSWVASTNVHTIYVDGVQYLQITDATYTGAAGNPQVGVRFYNGGGVGIAHQSYFDNFGIIATPGIVGNSPAPQLITNSVALGSITVGNSIVEWGQTLPSGAIINVLASVSGGAYVACTNGGVIPGLTPGTVLSSGTVRFKIQLQTPIASEYVALNGFTAWVSSAYSSSGTRISPVLSLNPVGRVGSSLVAWNANLPTGTSLKVETSPNGSSSWTDVTGSNGGTLPGFAVQPDPTVDNFAVDSHTSYTSTFATGGGAATWTWDTANSRLVATGGNEAILLHNSLTATDVDIQCILDEAYSAGLVWHEQDVNDFYVLLAADASSGFVPNTLRLFKVNAGTFTQIGSNISIAFARGTYHTLRATMFGTAITCYFDGQQMLAATDGSLGGPANVGLYNNTAGGGSTARFYSFRVQPQGDSMVGANIYSRLTLTSTDPTVTPQVLDLTLSAHNPNIGNGALIPTTSYSFYNGQIMTLAACFDDLASKSQVPTPYLWDIDKNLNFKFMARTATPAPFPVATANGDYLVQNLLMQNNSPTYLNRMRIIGGIDTATRTEIKLGDGLTQTWTLGSPVAPPTALGASISMTLNDVVGAVVQYPGIVQKVGVRGVDTGRDYYYQVGSTQITQDAAETPFDDTKALVITVLETVPVYSFAEDTTEQTAHAALEGAGHSGIVEMVESFPGLNKAASDALCAAKLASGKIKGRTFQFNSFHTGLASGQIINAFCPEHGLSNAVCLVSAVQTTYRNANTASGIQAVYQATIVEGQVLGDWTRFVAKTIGQ